MHQDKQLIKGCLKNDRASQKQLYEQYAQVMLGVCYRYSKTMADAEDMLQEGFGKVFKNLGQYKYEGELGAWIRKIMVTTALNYLKRNSKYQDDINIDTIEMHPEADDDPVIKLDAKELSALIQQLSIGYQTIFNLHAVEGYTHVEIGELLGISDGTSRSQYARARGLLIKLVKKYYLENKLKTYAG